MLEVKQAKNSNKAFPKQVQTEKPTKIILEGKENEDQIEGA